jgi:hypothetical protein
VQAQLRGLKTQSDTHKDFVNALWRFLPSATVHNAIKTISFWSYLIRLLDNLG